MPSAEFQFNFKFNLHKSSIPIGIADDDYPRLSAVYGVPLRDVLEEAEQAEQSNRAEAQRLLADFPALPGLLAGLRVAFLGDSISSDRRSFIHILRAALTDRSDAVLLDASVSGYKVVDILTGLVPEVTDFAPHIAHIMVGSNDMKRSTDGLNEIQLSVGEYRKDLRYVLGKLRGLGAQVVVSTIPPCDIRKTRAAFWDCNVQYLPEDRAAFNAVVREESAGAGCILNDMDAAYARHPIEQITEKDGLHLNALGQRLLTAGVAQSLLRAAI